MTRIQASRSQKSRRDRDEELRAAHRRAFEKMMKAASDRRAIAKQAVDELIDACEQFLCGPAPAIEPDRRAS